MRFVSSGIVCSALVLATSVPAFAGPRVHRGPTAPHAVKPHAVVKKVAAVRGIEPERATQIQAALVKAGYLSGTPSGVWDAQSEAAMQKLQADNGWQTKLVPDARAIIKLGLGPNASSSVASSEAPATGETKFEPANSIPDIQ